MKKLKLSAILIISVLCSLSVLSSCSDDSADPKTGNLLVWNGNTEDGVVHVKIENGNQALEGDIINTHLEEPTDCNDEGALRFLNLTYGTWALTATTEDGDVWSGAVIINSDCQVFELGE